MLDGEGVCVSCRLCMHPTAMQCMSTIVHTAGGVPGADRQGAGGQGGGAEGVCYMCGCLDEWTGRLVDDGEERMLVLLAQRAVVD